MVMDIRGENGFNDKNVIAKLYKLELNEACIYTTCDGKTTIITQAVNPENMFVITLDKVIDLGKADDFLYDFLRKKLIKHISKGQYEEVEIFPIVLHSFFGAINVTKDEDDPYSVIFQINALGSLFTDPIDPETIS